VEEHEGSDSHNWTTSSRDRGKKQNRKKKKHQKKKVAGQNKIKMSIRLLRRGCRLAAKEEGWRVVKKKAHEETNRIRTRH